jgi:DNA-binding response OmpR family regulator
MKKILLVEDNEHIMDINEWFLKSKGYDIDKAYSLKEADECLKKSLPDVIVLDIMLPDGDGVEYCERIQKKNPIPVLFLTAKTGKKDMMEGYKRGGNDYLTKPYDLEMLEVRIEALMRLSENTVKKDQMINDISRNVISLKSGALSFDPVASTLTVSGEKLSLSTKEFGILYCLAKRKGKQVTKEELLKEVWELEPDSDSSFLWSTIYRLKKKIAPYQDRFYIESDHSGYELVVIEKGSN